VSDSKLGYDCSVSVRPYILQSKGERVDRRMANGDPGSGECVVVASWYLATWELVLNVGTSRSDPNDGVKGTGPLVN